MLHYEEQLFTAVCSVKHGHFLLDVGDKVWESSSRKHMVLIDIKDVAIKKFEHQILWILLQSISEGKEKCSSLELFPYNSLMNTVLSLL